MRKFVVMAATLACAGAGLLAAALPQAAEQAAMPKVEAEKKAEPKTETRTKTVIVERHGHDDGPGEVYTWRAEGPPEDFAFAMAGVGSGVRIGVSVANLDDDQAKTMTGVVVTGVNEDGPAAKAGVKEKDVITEFDGEKVRSAQQLSRLVGETPPGRAVKLTAMRDGKRVDLQVTPVADEMAMFRHEGPMDPWTPDRMPRLHPGMPMGPGSRNFRPEVPGGREFEFHEPGEGGDDTFDVFIQPGRGRLGIGIQDLSEQLAEYFGTKDGVLVSSVMADSPAAKAGLRAGDVVTSINDTPVTSTDALIRAVKKAEDGGSLKVGYVRDKKPGTVTATLVPREKPKRSTRPI